MTLDVQAVVAAAAHWWAGEAEVVRAFCSVPRTPADHLGWLRAQAYKEWVPLLTLPEETRAALLRDGVAAGVTGMLADEWKHFRLLAALIEDLTSMPVVPSALAALPEDRRLQELRGDMRSRHGALGAACAAFTEGGGGAMYAELGRLDGGPFEQRVAEIFRVIHRDEITHGPAQLTAIAAAVHVQDDLDTACAIVGSISRQRLSMRNEMFGQPLTPARCAAIAAGRITPWRLPTSA
jgi:hypothetical protein